MFGYLIGAASSVSELPSDSLQDIEDEGAIRKAEVAQLVCNQGPSLGPVPLGITGVMV